MIFIEIKDGLSIAQNEIEAIERIDDFKCRVYTHHSSYESNFPYMTLLELLEMERPEEKGIKPKTEENLNAFLEKAGVFAG